MSCLRARGVLAVALALSVGPACATGGPPPSSIRDTARRTYYEGMRELVGGNYVRARQLFNEVSRSPGTVRYAALARLRTGDALYLQERYEEAVEVFRAFVAQSESDPNLPYARFRIAACYYKRIPGEWFASPPAYEIDQTMSHEAERELGAFLRTFPVSRFAPEARRMLAETRQMLADYELYVADFYDSRDRPRAAAWRIEEAMSRYPDLAVTADNVWRMADAYREAGDVADAARGYGLYLEKYPEGPKSDEARRRLDALRKSLEGGKVPPPAGDGAKKGDTSSD